MFWRRKKEIDVGIDEKKVILERFTVLGKLQRLKFIETAFPPQNGVSGDRIVSVTRPRFLWRFRIRHPLKMTCYRRNKTGEWEKVGSSIL